MVHKETEASATFSLSLSGSNTSRLNMRLRSLSPTCAFSTQMWFVIYASLNCCLEVRFKQANRDNIHYIHYITVTFAATRKYLVKKLQAHQDIVV